RLCALPALWVGLLYDRSALDGACDLAKGWTAEERHQLRHDAAKYGLRAEIGGRSLRDVARDVLELAHGGLRARARPGAGGTIPDDTHFLNALHEIVETGQTPSDEMLARYEGEWQRDMSRIYAEYSY